MIGDLAIWAGVWCIGSLVVGIALGAAITRTRSGFCLGCGRAFRRARGTDRSFCSDDCRGAAS